MLFNAIGKNNFMDTDYLLKELKLDTTQPCLLQYKGAIRGFYSIEEIVTSCKKNNLSQSLNMCIKDSLDYIVMVLKGYYEHNLEDLSSFTKDIIRYTELFESEKTYFCIDISVHIVDFLESLLNLLDSNYANVLTKEKVSLQGHVSCKYKEEL